MSRVDDLLARFCPDGVEMQPLGEVAPYSTSRVDSSTLDATNFVGVDNLLADRKGRTDASHQPNTARVTEYRPGDILLGNIRPYLKKVWLADRSGGSSGDVLVLRISGRWRGRVLPEYLYRVVASDSFFDYNSANAKGAKMPRGSKQAIARFNMAVPPLAVQRAVVEALAELERLEVGLRTELAAELDARSRLAEHHRRTLLSFGSAVPRVVLREIVHFENGRAHERLVDPDGDVSLVTARFISSNGLHVRRVPSADVRTPALRGDVCLVMSDLPKGRALARAFLVPADGEYAVNQRVCILRTLSEHAVLPRFAYYVLNRNDQLLRWDNGQDQTHLKKDQILNLEFPLPAVEEQRRIIDLLDALTQHTDSLVKSLSDEIEARRRQHEYYRNLLLNFPRKTA
ncbi:restriction endonuclease subunit S [Nocardioides xinjiangensis]|uniref:restriction endonuclease subunit S n=1 Tax=Nocardioides xinjiangensis TaxID=2817376 RepID=UPI001B31661C|nr:restriction endonuclease subunit S [Nocardioides sp. SYSU D00778]